MLDKHLGIEPQLQALFGLVKVNARDSTIITAKMACKRELQATNHWNTKKKMPRSVTFSVNLDDLKDYSDNILWIDNWSFFFLEDMGPVTLGVKLKQHSKKKNITSKVKHGGDRMMAPCAVSGPGQLMIIDRTIKFALNWKKFERESPPISLWPEAQSELDEVHLWNNI